MIGVWIIIAADFFFINICSQSSTVHIECIKCLEDGLSGCHEQNVSGQIAVLHSDDLWRSRSVRAQHLTSPVSTPNPTQTYHSRRLPASRNLGRSVPLAFYSW